MGKSEGREENWHGHVTCLSVRSDFRRSGMAGKLMSSLEKISEAYVYIFTFSIIQLNQ